MKCDPDFLIWGWFINFNFSKNHARKKPLLLDEEWAKEWTLELFSKRVLSLSWWVRSMPFKSSWNFVETHNKDHVTFVPWEVYPCVWVYLHICSLTSFMHEKVSLSVSVQVVTTVMLYSRLIYLRGPFCMISISLAEAS